MLRRSMSGHRVFVSVASAAPPPSLRAGRQIGVPAGHASPNSTTYTLIERAVRQPESSTLFDRSLTPPAPWQVGWIDRNWTITQRTHRTARSAAGSASCGAAK
jgi:hypothetical protein